MKRYSFVGKSLLWALLLYVTTMLVLNWNDIKSRAADRSDVSYIRSEEKTPSVISIIDTMKADRQPLKQPAIFATTYNAFQQIKNTVSNLSKLVHILGSNSNR